MTGLLDKLPASVRHALLMLLGATVTTVLANQQWITSRLPDALVPLAGALLSIIATAVTPFTTQYGVGSTSFPDSPGDPGNLVG